MKSRYALLASILFGILAVFLLKKSMEDRERAQKMREELVKVLVAADTLSEGHTIKKTDLAEAEIPQKHFGTGMARDKDWEALVDKKLVVAVEKNCFFRLTDVKPKASETTISPIDKGERLYTMQVDLYSGVGGRLRPGSMVDVLAVVREPDVDAAADAKGGRKSGSGERVVTLLERVKVFAVGPVSVTRTGYANEGTLYSAVTLRVLPEEAELLSYAAAQGRLTLIERSNLDGATGKTPPEGISRATFDARLREARGAR